MTLLRGFKKIFYTAFAVVFSGKVGPNNLAIISGNGSPTTFFSPSAWEGIRCIFSLPCCSILEPFSKDCLQFHLFHQPFPFLPLLSSPTPELELIVSHSVAETWVFSCTVNLSITYRLVYCLPHLMISSRKAGIILTSSSKSWQICGYCGRGRLKFSRFEAVSGVRPGIWGCRLRPLPQHCCIKPLLPQ